MLKKWFNKVFSNRQTSPTVKATSYAADALGLGASNLNFAAEKVLKRLQQHGFEAYVVGGAVRDLLLGIEPKDFDVATNASPEQIRKMFRRSRIIGRRFRIVHVMVGPETIEVTTFRGGQAHQNDSGRIMKDNEYGTQVTDALRRDFTCNALYFDPFSNVVLDQLGGVDDVHARKLVMIGDPEVRYQEDPVRILRAVRLSSKLGFEIAPETQAPLVKCAANLQNEPVARLFDEVIKLLLCGQAHYCLQRFSELGLTQKIHPYLNILFEQGIDTPFVKQALDNTDERIRAHKNVSVGFILAATLWPSVESAWAAYVAKGYKDAHGLNTAIADIKERMERQWGVPHKISAIMREIWQMQVQFDFRRGVRALKTLEQPRFRAAYDFMALRASVGEVDSDLVEWWTQFQRVDTITQELMLKEQNSHKNQAVSRGQVKQAIQQSAQESMDNRGGNQPRRSTYRRRAKPRQTSKNNTQE